MNISKEKENITSVFFSFSFMSAKIIPGKVCIIYTRIFSERQCLYVCKHTIKEPVGWKILAAAGNEKEERIF